MFLLCLRHVNGCDRDSDCQTSYETCDDGECKHKHIFSMHFKEFAGIVVIVSMSTLSSAGGIGGGTIVVPIFKIFFNFRPSESVALANTFMVASSLTRFVINYRKRHPLKDKVLIDYQLVSALFPILLVGSTVGVMFNIILPEVIQTIFFTILLTLLSLSIL